jgi:tetratricopeptide (TPR) repeat protein
MTMRRWLPLAVLCMVVGSGIALATWYDDYEAGIKAVRAGQWSAVIQKMTSAINQKGKENNKERAYGTLFENYHPFYYRAVAYLNTGQYDKAIADLDKSSGPGEEDLGSIENLHGRAQLKLDQRSPAASPEPGPTPTQTQPAQPPPVQTRPPVVPPAVTTQPAAPAPSVPALDPAARQRADAAIAKANQRLKAAQGRHATEAPSYRQATQNLADANLRRASAKTTDEFNQIAALAENAAVFADSSQTQIAAVPAPVPRAGAPKPAAATDIVLDDAKKRVRHALEQYFNGDFDTAATELDKLANGDMKSNGMVWAFLGASQYSIYAFEADPQYRDAARRSFARARQLRPSLARTGLPDRYFSRRIRNFFKTQL